MQEKSESLCYKTLGLSFLVLLLEERIFLLNFDLENSAWENKWEMPKVL